MITANKERLTMLRLTQRQRSQQRQRTGAMSLSPVQANVIQMNAAYDLADRNPEINEQFGRANRESGRTALNPTDRRTMIDRSRYEIFQANPWLKGSARSTTVSVVGRGAEIEINIPGDEDQSGIIEDQFNDWLVSVKSGRKFRAMANAKQSDGPGMAIVFTNSKRPDDGIQLDFLPFDCDHIRAPWDWQIDTKEQCLDGKVIDRFGDVVAYWMTPEHPAENPMTVPVKVAAEFILDVWDWGRPSQSIGAPEYATSVKNGPLTRAFRRATLDGATTAAKHTWVMQTNVDRFDDGSHALEPMSPWIQVPTQYGTGMAIPAGWSLSQMKAENPNSNHEAFIKSLASEHGRAVNQPNFIALGDASDQNMSSMAGLRQEWELEVACQRQDWETEVLDKLLILWLKEAAALGLIDRKYADVRKVKHVYRWAKRRHADTSKEYSGRETAIRIGARSRRQWQMDDGLDPTKEDQMSAQGFGVTEEQYQRALFVSTFGDAARAVLGLPTMVEVQLELVKNQKQQQAGGGNG